MSVSGSAIRKVLLLNPPFKGLYIRDQFCSHLSKGTYYWQPLDLLLLSGRLHADGYEVAVLDAVAEGLTIEQALGRVGRFAPDAVIFLTGCDSFAEDMAFVKEIKAQGARLAIGIGDILREKGETLLEENPGLDAGLVDFVTHGVHAFLQGDVANAENLIVRGPGGIRKIPVHTNGKFFRLPSPRYQLFPLDRYRMPYNRYHPYATIISSTWCPFACSFCPFAKTPYRIREVDDVLANLEEIRDLGIRQVHFADWTFGVHRKQAKAILEGMIERKYRFSWSCLSRVDLMDEEMMRLLKLSGCDLIEFGVESGNQAMLDRYEKDTTLEQIREAFRLARKLKLSTLATFVLGLPGETHETMQQTLDLALEIEPSFCSFNMASPQPATQLRRTMVEQGLLDPERPAILDSSRSLPVFSTATLSNEEVYRFRNQAIRRFYGRPSYVWRRLCLIRSTEELLNHVRNGASLIWQTLRMKPVEAELSGK